MSMAKRELQGVDHVVYVRRRGQLSPFGKVNETPIAFGGGSENGQRGNVTKT